MSTYNYTNLSISQYEDRLLNQFNALDQVQEIRNPFPQIRDSRFSSLWTYTSKIYHLFEDLKEPRDNLSVSEQTFLMEHYLTTVFETFHYIDRQTTSSDKLLFYTFVFPFLSQLGTSLYDSNELQDKVLFNLLPQSHFVGSFAVYSYSSAFSDPMGMDSIMTHIFGDTFPSVLRKIKDLIEFITNFFDDYDDDFNDHEPQEEPRAESFMIEDDQPRFMLRQCSSCFEENIHHYVITSCRHTACHTCASRWLRAHQTCWYCRQAVSECSPAYSCHASSFSEEDMIGHIV